MTSLIDKNYNFLEFDLSINLCILYFNLSKTCNWIVCNPWFRIVACLIDRDRHSPANYFQSCR